MVSVTYTCLIVFITLFIIICDGSFCATNETLVIIPQGTLRGSCNVFGNYRHFFGVPFASNRGRFEKPGRAPKWNGTYFAKSSPICKQYSPLLKSIIGQEDCLYLNIYTPLSNQTNRPVIVFIHGGGYYWGSNSDLIYNPKYLVDKNVVVVSVNYRLGAFGFLCLGNEGAPGNVGLKDQIASLKWVQNNIKYFGGDPRKVTVLGESVGATSVNYFLLSPLFEGLFQRVIMQSGSVMSMQAIDRNPIKSASIVASRLGFNTSDPDELLEIFKRADADDLVRASYSDPTNNVFVQYMFRPCVENINLNDKHLIEEDPQNLMKYKINKDIDVIIGYNDKEGIMWADKYDALGLERLNVNFENVIPDNLIFQTEYDKRSFIEEVKRFYFKNNRISTASTDGLIDYFSDLLVMYPMHLVIDSLVKNRNKVYCYYFTYDSFRNLNKFISPLRYVPGANHGDELLYLFDPLIFKVLPGSVNDKKMVYTMSTLWSNFAKNGSPSITSTDIQWPASGEKIQFINFDKPVKITDIPNKERIKFWQLSAKKWF